MGDSPNASASASHSIASVADKIVGDIVLGGIGRVAYHVGKIPGVKPVAAYIGDNIRDGYNAAESADLCRKAVAAIRQIQSDTGLTLTVEQMRCLARDAGVTDSDLDKVVDAAYEAANGSPAPGVSIG